MRRGKKSNGPIEMSGVVSAEVNGWTAKLNVTVVIDENDLARLLSEGGRRAHLTMDVPRGLK